MTYMNYIDKNIKTIEENDTVGIIICKQDNEYVIKYCSDDRIIAREYEFVRYNRDGVDKMKRVIFIEPEIEDSEVILAIFKKYNPDSSFVNPHICLVFPFESDLQTVELETIITDTFSKYGGFDIQLSDLSVSYEERNNFLFLNVIDESNILGQMSSELYNRLGENAKLKGNYTPHITIGKSKSNDDINQIHKESQLLLRKNYNANIFTIYCKRLINDKDGNIRLEDEIEFKLPQKFNKIK